MSVQSKESPPTAKNSAPDQAQPWCLVATGDWLAGQRFVIKDQAVLGRESSCDITIPGTHLSRRHAELTVLDNALLVRDLNSANGTYVNGQKISEIEVVPGDEIKFDVLTFTVIGPANSPARDAAAATDANSAHGSTTPAPERKFKVKPTSVGNRDRTVQMTITEKAATSVARVIMVFVGVVAVLVLIFMLTQL